MSKALKVRNHSDHNFLLNLWAVGMPGSVTWIRPMFILPQGPHLHPATQWAPSYQNPYLISHLGSLYSYQKQCEKCLKRTTGEEIVTSYLVWHQPESLSEAPYPRQDWQGRELNPQEQHVGPGDFRRGGISVAIPAGGGQAVHHMEGWATLPHRTGPLQPVMMLP